MKWFICLLLFSGSLNCLEAANTEEQPQLTLKVTPLEKEIKFKEGKVYVAGMGVNRGLVDYSIGMTILDAVEAAGGERGKVSIGKKVIVKSPKRGVEIEYYGISGSFRKEAWKLFYGSILIAEGDFIEIYERVF